MARLLQLEGKRFGRLQVLSLHSSGTGKGFWKCVCDCGTEKILSTRNLTSPVGARSCGCSRRSCIDDSFWLRLVKDKKSGCWVWTGATTQFGYGKVGFNNNKYDCHRLAFESCVGPIPKVALVCHHCDNPRCCNPVHLYLGTPKSNMVDRSVRRRMRTKLSPESVVSIRQLSSGGLSPRRIAAVFGVTKQCIRSIIAGKTWSHVA